MKKLTENLIQQRLKSCTTDLDKVMQINVTGIDLEDVSLLQKMTGVEILSFSVNNITSLAEFRFCKNLKELYLRNNKISDLKQISYLKNLPKLKLLMLSENPCTKDPLYRMTVIKTLKNLTELDGIAIKAEERRQAQKLGRDILSEDEEKAQRNELNNKTINQNCSKLNKSEKSVVEVGKPREVGEVKEPKETCESRQTKEAQQSTESKEFKEVILGNNKFTTENDPREFDEFDMMENIEQSFNLSSASENEKSEREFFNTRMKSMSPRSSFCKYCGRKEKPKLRNMPKNYNLLSATIKLVGELDYPCLQILNEEVNFRLNLYEMYSPEKLNQNPFDH